MRRIITRTGREGKSGSREVWELYKMQRFQDLKLKIQNSIDAAVNVNGFVIADPKLNHTT